MKLSFLVLLASACAFASVVPVSYTNYKVVDKQWLQWQMDFFDLFKWAPQTSYDKEYVETSKTWKIENHMDSYTNTTAVKQFVKWFKQGMLPKGEIFSVFYEEQLKEAIALFKVFYYAKDLDTFYKTAVWARNNVNEGVFVYAFSVAITHREDTYGMVLPPIYEIWPYYFFNDEVIQAAQEYKQYYSGNGKEYHTINANYSGWYLNVQPEQSLSYFTEDIGLNAYYYYYNLYYPYWFSSEGFESKYSQRGEQFYYFYKQLLARYYQERLSQGFGEIPSFDWETPFEFGYYPSLSYHNGLSFPERPDYVSFFKNYYNYGQSWSWKGKYPYSYTFVKDYERRIRDAIDTGYVYTFDGKKVDLFDPKGFEVLGDLIEANPDSPNSRFYGALQIFARHLLGYSFQPMHKYKVAPSALQHFETSLRDPAFWMLYKRIMLYFYKYKSYRPAYTPRDLVADGYTIESVVVDKMVTFFEDFDVSLINAVYAVPQDWEKSGFEVYARQKRLTHKPFSYKVTVNSEKPSKVVVRTFFGPKYDEYGRPIDMNENWMNFVEWDKFVWEFQAGKNVIERHSEDFWFADDFTTAKDMYQYFQGAYNGQYEYKWFNGTNFYGFPQRFVVPTGTYGGQTFQFYVIVTPYVPATPTTKESDSWYPQFGTWFNHIDNKPLGWPFDRPVEGQVVSVPNAYFADAKVYFKDQTFQH